MRAIVYERFGGPDVLEQRLLPAPVPRAGEVLVRVKAAALNPKDSFVRKGRFAWLSGRRFPRLLGYDVSGVVEVVGPGGSRFIVGDAVFGMRNGFDGGTVAEFVTVRADELAKKPARVSFEEAAAAPLAYLTALQALRDCGGLREGGEVLVHGASGGVGVFAVQVARRLGARVTTTSSARNFELLKGLGAAETLDYAADDGLGPGRAWDVCFDVFGNRSFARAKAALAPRGVYVSTVPSPANILTDLTTRFRRGRRGRLVVVRSNAEDLEHLAAELEAGTVRAVIDRVVPLAETAAAQAHIETKRARGKVVIRVE
ncbi:MAG: NAD(P)-dependent alcohol dehydrogenase [Myxococcaceae bacterium]|nr:NAD(P)-dependent alcohol dehydrogenase [Myxococcaceae bacterium]MCA3014317.1 NAD(P)-dependent alcohol dehydrogenase [Myxococcaceae bacterium]